MGAFRWNVRVLCGQSRASTRSEYCWLSSSLALFSHVSADDFLEPEEYVEEPAGVMPKAAADLDAEAMRYKELVRRNVELFIATSQKCIQETELSQRIRDWEDTIQPLLQEQVRRAIGD